MRAMGVLSAGVAALLVASAAQADVKAGVDAWQAGDFGRAVAEWQPLADQGNADAQFNLGQAYKLGQGVPKNMQTAQDLFTKAANQGHEQAQATLGLILFQNGDRVNAMPWIKKAAEAGEPRAQYIYGTALYNGDVVARDLPAAYAMMSRAANAGLPQAASSLSVMEQRMAPEDRAKGVELAKALPTDTGRAVVAQNTPAASSAPDRGAPRVLPSTFSLANNNATPTAPAAPPSPKPAPAPAPKPVQVASAEPKPAPAPKAAPAPKPAAAPKPAPAPKPVAVASAEPKPAPAPKPTPKPAAAAPKSGPWRIQLGAFSSADGARNAWKSASAAMAGRGPSYVPAGKFTRLQVAGFASEAAASQACAAVKRSGGACLTVRP